MGASGGEHSRPRVRSHHRTGTAAGLRASLSRSHFWWSAAWKEASAAVGQWKPWKPWNAWDAWDAWNALVLICFSICYWGPCHWRWCRTEGGRRAWPRERDGLSSSYATTA